MNQIITDYLKQIIDLSKRGIKVSERVERIQFEDRENYNDLVNRVGHLEVELKSLKDVVNKLSTNTRDQVAEAVAPILEETSLLSKVIENKTSAPIPRIIHKSWLDKIRDRIRGLRPKWAF